MLNVSLLRDSLAQATEREPIITRRFYEILFDRYPQVRPLFGHNSTAKQQQMLQEALVAVLDHIDDGRWLESTLGGLGVKHIDYGVTEEMYAWVGDALISTLAELVGDDWTPAHAEAWAQAYDAIAQLMLRGAASVPTAAVA